MSIWAYAVLRWVCGIYNQDCIHISKMHEPLFDMHNQHADHIRNLGLKFGIGKLQILEEIVNRGLPRKSITLAFILEELIIWTIGFPTKNSLIETANEQIIVIYFVCCVYQKKKINLKHILVIYVCHWPNIGLHFLNWWLCPGLLLQIIELLEKDSIEWTEEDNGQIIVIRVDKVNPKRLSFAKKTQSC